MLFYPHFPGDYRRKTLELSELEDLMYRRLLDAYYTIEGPIRKDCVYKHADAHTPAGRRAVDSVLRKYFKPCGKPVDKWRNARCDREIAAYHRRSEQARSKANLRWKNKDLHATAVPGQSSGSATHTHTHNKNKESEDQQGPFENQNVTDLQRAMRDQADRMRLSKA